MQKTVIGTGLVARLRGWAPEREIFLCAGGTVRSLRITTRMQVVAASIAAMLLGAWLLSLGLMARQQAVMQAEQARVAATRSIVSGEAARASADRRSVDGMVHDLEKRQDALDTLMESHFGADVDQGRVVGEDKSAKAADAPRKISQAPSGAPSGKDRLAAVRERQRQFASALRGAATTRLAVVEAAIRAVGLNPAQLKTAGRGGPFVPAVARATPVRDDRQLSSLANLLDRLAMMESALTVLPSGQPTRTPMASSSYGYRRDPFNGLAAFHAGIDFPGAYGQPVLAASEGKVAFAGQKSGYGNCIEVDHGHGIVTRYAHLAGFTARVGQKVERGQQIARMGSTGRSTGTHLHFEVRVNDAAIDPRPFLRAKSHVLEARRDATGIKAAA